MQVFDDYLTVFNTNLRDLTEIKKIRRYFQTLPRTRE